MALASVVLLSILLSLVAQNNFLMSPSIPVWTSLYSEGLIVLVFSVTLTWSHVAVVLKDLIVETG